LLRLTAILANPRAKALSPTLSHFCHAVCLSDARHSFVPQSLAELTSQLVLARANGRLKPLRGERGGGHALLFVRALYRAGSPRNPRTPARAREVLTVP